MTLQHFQGEEERRARPLTGRHPRHRVSPSASPMTGSSGDPVRCWPLDQSLAFLEYWVARSSRAMTAAGVNVTRTTARLATFSLYATIEERSESALVRRYAVIARQLRFLRAIAPIEILVGAECGRATQLFIVDVELVGLESRIVFEASPRQRQQIGSDAEEPAETEDRVGYLAADFIDHQPLDVADPLPIRPSHRGALDPIARDQLVRFCHDVGHHHHPPFFGLMRWNQRVGSRPVPLEPSRIAAMRDCGTGGGRLVPAPPSAGAWRQL